MGCLGADIIVPAWGRHVVGGLPDRLYICAGMATLRLEIESSFIVHATDTVVLIGRLTDKGMAHGTCGRLS